MENPTPSNDLIEIIATFITILGTYFITKFQIMNPSKIEIKRQQLKKVYLPLNKLLADANVEIMDNNQLVSFINDIAKIFENNYLLIYPDLFEVYKDLKFDIYSNLDISNSYKNFCNIIFYDYEKLKRYLGYPSESYKDFFARVDTPTKIKEVSSWIYLILIFVPIIYLGNIDDINGFTFLKFIAFYIISFIVITKINSFLTSIQRRK